MKSYKTTPPSFKTVLQHPWLWISTFFGSGCITPAPGTWGSFAAWGVFLLLDMWLGRSFIWAAALVIFVLGCVSVGKSTVYLNKVDHGSIVGRPASDAVGFLVAALIRYCFPFF